MNYQTTKQRNQIIQAIRDFFRSEDFLEVETPIMVHTPGMEPHLSPFETKYQDDTPLFLHTSPELQMKKLLSQPEFKKIFQLTKTFRNGESSKTHNPEFTMLEWYSRPADYHNLMDECEKLIKTLCQLPFISDTVRQKIIQPWQKFSTQELFLKYCQIDLLENRDYSTFKNTAETKGYNTNGCQDWDDIFFKIFLNHIEPELGSQAPTIVYDYPSTQAALAQKSTQEPFFAERFELYINRLELTNGFSELTDSKEQRQRLKEEQALRKKLGKTIFHIDEEFLSSLESITEPAAGIALGLDRLIMLLLEKDSISEVINFPFHGNNY